MRKVKCRDVEGNEYVVSVDKLQWRPSVYGIVVKNKKILLSKQFGDRYDLPGGGLELGETPEEGVIREVKEETGIKVHSPQLIGLKNSFFQASHAANGTFHSLLIYYLCEYIGGKLSTEGFDEWEKKYAEMAEWVPLPKLSIIEPASTVDFRPYIKKALSL